MELLKELVPSLRRVAYVGGNPGAIVNLPSAAPKIFEEDPQIAASTLGLTWQIFILMVLLFYRT
jgi:hypothetical protein